MIAWLLLALVPAAPAGPQNLLTDPGFEQNPGNPGGWSAYEKGFERDRSTKRTGEVGAHCANMDASELRGATTTVTLDQKAAAPVTVSGWSKASGVGGSEDADYSIYLDVRYMDGTPLWGQTAPFPVGTHDWEYRKVTVFPTKPIRSIAVFALFRRHAGEVWFDDFEAVEYLPGKVFDGQLVSPPKFQGSDLTGWFVRDVAADSPVTASPSTLGLKLALKADGEGVTTATVEDTTGKTRAVTVYYVERFSASDATWWDDVRTSRLVGQTGEYFNMTRLPNVGAIGAASLYPFACITGGGVGLALGVPPLQGPRVMRAGYQATAKLAYVAFDVALVPDNAANSDGKGHGKASVSLFRSKTDAKWGFRAAADAYYKRFPEAFDHRAQAEGLWMPFTAPQKVHGFEDFGFAYHEGDNSVAQDDFFHILSFRYTEPMSWWMAMPPAMPRTYSEAVALAESYLTGSDLEKRRWAQALKNSGSKNRNGLYNVQFQNAPWTNGAVWALNANPNLPCPPGETTKAKLNYTKEKGDALYPPQSKPSDAGLDGEYLDSIEGWSDVLDFRPESLKYSTFPPTFTSDTHMPVVPLWFSTYETAAFMRSDLRRRGKLLMANSTPWRFHEFLPLLDVAGTEVNWAAAPDSDAVFNLRRTLCYHKPYLLLQNTDFDKFGPEKLEAYIKRSMFYAVYPSMFSADASSAVYWENPAWYDVGRPLFKKYVPVIKKLSAAGWEPITYARSGDPKVYVERYGREYLTLFNDSDKEITASLVVQLKLITGAPAQVTDLLDVFTGRVVATIEKDAEQVYVGVKPLDCLVLRLTARR